MRFFCLGWIALLLLAGDVSPAAAQVVTVPPGSVRGLFGGGASAPAATDLALTVDLDGGYENNSAPGSTTSADLFGPIQSGYVSTAVTTLRFQKGIVDRYVLATGNASISQQQVASGFRAIQLFRGLSALQLATTLSRRSGVTASASVAYEPTFLFGAFTTLGSNSTFESPIETVPVPTEDPSLSITQQNWLATRASAGAFYNWTPRQRMSVRYDGEWLRPLEGAGVETRNNTATVFHAWDATRNAGIDVTYRYSDNPQILETTERTLVLQAGEARFRYSRRMSPSRSVAFMAGGGAVQVKAGPLGNDRGFEVVAPTFSALARVGFARTWGVSLTARRDITVLGGLSAEPFESNAAMLTIDGTVARRLWMAATAGLSQGRARRAAGGDFDLAMVTAQARYGFGSRLGLLVRYQYNEHEFRGIAVTPASFPFRFNRNSIRVGLTMWLPLYGTF